MSRLNRKYNTGILDTLKKTAYQPPAPGPEAAQMPPGTGAPMPPMPPMPPGGGGQGMPPMPPGGGGQGMPPMPPMPPGGGEMSAPVQVDAAVLDEAIEKAVERGIQAAKEKDSESGSGKKDVPETRSEDSSVQELKEQIDSLRQEVASLKGAAQTVPETGVEYSPEEEESMSEGSGNISDDVKKMFTEDAAKSMPAEAYEKYASEKPLSFRDRMEKKHYFLQNGSNADTRKDLIRRIKEEA